MTERQLRFLDAPGMTAEAAEALAALRRRNAARDATGPINAVERSREERRARERDYVATDEALRPPLPAGDEPRGDH